MAFASFGPLHWCNGLCLINQDLAGIDDDVKSLDHSAEAEIGARSPEDQ